MKVWLGLGISAVALVFVASSCGSDGEAVFPNDSGFGVDEGGLFGDDSGFFDGASGCTPKTCSDLGYTCGPNGDGCGGLIDCGMCTAPQFCGGGGYSICGGNSGLLPDGAPMCTPTTCQQLGFNCGPAGDGCGGLLQCGSCNMPDICGGGGKPSVCGNSVPCVNLCKQQSNCDGGPLTTITGKVVAGTLQQYGSPDPVPGVLVYVPNSQVQPFSKGVQCSQCGADVTGDPLVQTTTAVDGTFTLKNVPIGNNIPVVIQLGRWRRQVTFNVPGCVTTAVGNIRMPRNKGEGDIPFTAISTGNVDAIECVLLKMGVDAAEFTNPGAGGRMEFYVGNGARSNNNTPPETTLINSLATEKTYDQIFFPCWGFRANKTNQQLADLITYGDSGGRVFATHYSYSWLYTNAPWSQSAQWNVDANALNSTTSEVDTSFQKGKTFAQWLNIVGALTQVNPPQMTLAFPRHDFDSVNAPASRWMYTVGQNPNFPVHYTFDTPWNKQNTCGRVIFSDFHVTNSATTGVNFPNECTNAAMTAQEKALEYMIWDLASCVPPPPKPLCTPLTCQQQMIGCGPAGDGCGNLLQCGPCNPPQTCGGGGQNGQCGYPEAGKCVPNTCQGLGINCGPAGDGCGGLLQCGMCTFPDTCGGGGTAGKCGNSNVN
jgi:hypothetical protein